MKNPRLGLAALGVLLLLVAGMAAYRLSAGGAAAPAAEPRKVKDLGTWKGGALAMIEDRRSASGVRFYVRWESGDRSLQLGGPHRDIPLVKDMPTGDLILVVGEPGRYNLQVWKAPEGPFDVKFVSTRRDIEDELGKLNPGKGK
jgi:hypothetical protein